MSHLSHGPSDPENEPADQSEPLSEGIASADPNRESTFSRLSRKPMNVLEHLVVGAAMIALLVVVVTVVWQVIARYVTSTSTAWAPELAQTAFVWTALLAIPIGVRRGRHMLVNIWSGRGEKLQKVFFTFASVAVMVICVALVVFGIDMLQTSFRRSLPSLGISAGWQMLAVPISFALSFIFQAEVLVRRFTDPESVEVDRAKQTL